MKAKGRSQTSAKYDGTFFKGVKHHKITFSFVAAALFHHEKFRKSND